MVILNWFLGVRPERQGLRIDPVIPEDWPGFRMKRLFRGATYQINVKNPDKAGHGVKQRRVDGKKLDSNVIPPFSDGAEHQVEVILG